ncbi:hypothetical protein [Gordonia oryzae]|nr:hypothetical protein [Gordonia oryzae]
MFLAPFILIAAIIYTVARTLTTNDSAPQSTSYLRYRATMRKRLKAAIIPPIAAAVILTTYGIVAQALDPTNPNVVPEPLRITLGLLWWPGICLFPLLAMLLTEKTTRPSGPPVATLAPRGTRELIPRWLLRFVSSICLIAALTPLILVSPLGATRIMRSANNPPTVNYSVDGTDIWMAYVVFLVAAILTVSVIRVTIRRRDIDPITGSDGWSRSGTAVRALCVLYIPAALVIVNGLTVPRNAALAYLDHIRAGGESIDGWPRWLASTAPAYIADGTSAMLMLGVVVALVIFARPPMPRALALTAESPIPAPHHNTNDPNDPNDQAAAR